MCLKKWIKQLYYANSNISASPSQIRNSSSSQRDHTECYTVTKKKLMTRSNKISIYRNKVESIYRNKERACWSFVRKGEPNELCCFVLRLREEALPILILHYPLAVQNAILPRLFSRIRSLTYTKHFSSLYTHVTFCQMYRWDNYSCISRSFGSTI